MDEVKRSTSRSYGQFCALARALDVVGDRWNLLIVRELLPGPLRYSELKGSLAGIATNLLAERLRSLESSGILERRLGEPGVVYALTEWGSELREPMAALGRWGAPLVASGRGDDFFHPRWLVLAIPALLQGTSADPPRSVGLEVDGYLINLRIDQTGPHATAGLDPRPPTTLSASPDTVVALAAGAITVDQAITMGHLDGDAEHLREVFRRTGPKS
ncbi:helix-turn-helix domain-containing protein [Mycolicibacterium sp. 050232]|uniref:helix-turn-helix domain-containing protein n=1 Tax=Mycolicibacterium sp. 050232 TaxID=3113982 RepID=UPI002E2976AF|nr:helix-turn-helix domain-containing protein [Mycolicibacterium sp. 050232]MED5816349.1 helix-turn-helix domain-containing protein [Mycolicibacterium sp. 050232]